MVDASDQSAMLGAMPILPAGTRLGPYVVLDRLGAGGMGQVFLATDTRLNRRVALKCLTAAAAGDDLRSDIVHEARAAAQISHPHVAAVHDVIEQEGRAFLVMEYVEGESLADTLRRQRIPLERALRIGRQLASALTAAHAKGIVHRDLKPANIQLTPDGSVKVLDFGVAQAISLLSTMSEGTTRSAQKPAPRVQPGTPAYMSPEQLLGRTVDHRSDIYSLGVVLYEMTTGHRPYSTVDPLDVVVSLTKRLLRPDETDRQVPREVSDVIVKAIALKPNDRFQTAAELEAALADLAGSYERLAPPSLRTATDRRTGRLALQLATAALLVPIVLGLLGVLMTEVLNVALQRSAPFNRESPWLLMQMGLRSVVAPAVYIGAMLIVLWATRFILHVLSLSRWVDRVLTTTRSRTQRLSSRLGLDDPVVFGQAVATMGVLAFAFVVWRFSPVIAAWMGGSTINDPPERFLPFWPGHREDSYFYRLTLNALTLLFSAAILHLVRLRALHPARRGGAALAIVVTMLVLIVLLNTMPYRLMWQSRFERIHLGNERCYVIGEHSEEWLLYCPDRNPPRNQVITRTDPAVRRSGLVESIFTPLATDRR